MELTTGELKVLEAITGADNWNIARADIVMAVKSDKARAARGARIDRLAKDGYITQSTRPDFLVWLGITEKGLDALAK